MSCLRSVFLPIGVGFFLFSSLTFAGFATETESDRITATNQTVYFWSDKKVLVRSRCKPGLLVNPQNCGKKVAPTQVLSLMEVLPALKALLTHRIRYDIHQKELIARQVFIEQQIELRKKHALTKEVAGLEEDLKAVRRQLAAFLSPEQVTAQMEAMLTTDPNLVIVKGEGTYADAEKNADLLKYVFEFVAPDDAVASWCVRHTVPRKLFVALAPGKTPYQAEKDCLKIGGQLAHEDFFPECSAIQHSPLAKAGPFWIAVNEEPLRHRTVFWTDAKGCWKRSLPDIDKNKGAPLCLIRDYSHFATPWRAPSEKDDYYQSLGEEIVKTLPCR